MKPDRIAILELSARIGPTAAARELRIPRGVAVGLWYRNRDVYAEPDTDAPKRDLINRSAAFLDRLWTHHPEHIERGDSEGENEHG